MSEGPALLAFEDGIADLCPRCRGPGSARFRRRILLFDGVECRLCRHLDAFPMTTAYRAGCFAAPVLPSLFGIWWLALLLAALSAAFLLLDLRLWLSARNAARNRRATAVPDARGRATEMKEGRAPAGAGAIDVREARGAQELLDWTLTSSLVAGFIASMFVSEIVLPFPDVRMVLSINWRWAEKLPKFTPQTSTLIAFGLYAYFVALSWFAARKLALSRHISSNSRWLYMSLLLVPGVNVLAHHSLSERAKDACGRVAA